MPRPRVTLRTVELPASVVADLEAEAARVGIPTWEHVLALIMDGDRLRADLTRPGPAIVELAAQIERLADRLPAPPTP